MCLTELGTTCMYVGEPFKPCSAPALLANLDMRPRLCQALPSTLHFIPNVALQPNDKTWLLVASQTLSTISQIMDQSPIHSSLDSNHDQLRLLILHSGNQDDPIHCSLKTCLISETEPYEALSYVWGDATITTPIYIGPLHKKFEVTTNLACALSHLRLEDHDRVLWVDALCS
jgi:hypothetical protein